MPPQNDGLGLDFLTHVVNVQWGGGGVFIAGNCDGNIYYLKLETEERTPVWQALGKLDFHKEEGGFFTGRVAGSAFGNVDVKNAEGDVIGTRPVFVLVGGHDYTDELGIIMASRDGLDWSRVFTLGGDDEDDTFKSAGIVGVAWNADDHKFYASAHQTDLFVDSDADRVWVQETDILLVSVDGFAWQETGRHAMRVDGAFGDILELPPYKTGLLVEHCRPLVTDGNGNNVPDGNYAYSSDHVLVRPATVIKIDYLFGIYLSDFPTGTTIVATSDEDIAPAHPTEVGFSVTCTATVGDRWLAAGGVIGNFDAGTGRSQSAILVAAGDHFAWQQIAMPGGTNAICTMTAGSIDAGL